MCLRILVGIVDDLVGYSPSRLVAALHDVWHLIASREHNCSISAHLSFPETALFNPLSFLPREHRILEHDEPDWWFARVGIMVYTEVELLCR